ncbi:Der GTPase-activating protein YihI [Cognaticolwellia mytili]|uniref:Der GTPase-activating protein YihI n=1 Tax=Cognaticolwellia mytili TaxID=1888913 RepID=UPI000A175500|nr:Der GTPase-activating protein YihI [Cognaticolwellia mytili]
MSRSKKSRKPGTGSIGAVKDDRKKAVLEPVPRRTKKKNGKEAGNRQKEATASITNAQNSAAKKDPRIGNKTPIDLGKAATAPINSKPVKTKQPKKAQESSPIAAIRVVEVAETLAEQLNSIEQDERLLAILEKQDAEETLTSEEVDYYNELMEKHEKISEEIGEDEEDEVIITSTRADSEDDLWDKIDNSDLSRFE